MKKYPTVLLALFLTLMFAVSCAGDEEPTDVNEGAADMVDRGPVEPDVDFTRFSSTIAEAMFFDILSNSGNYIGNTIKARGEYFSLSIRELSRSFHYVTIVPGDACCPAEGFELKFTDENATDDDFPDENTMIEVVGILGIYEHEELGQRFLYLAVDEIIILRH